MLQIQMRTVNIETECASEKRSWIRFKGACLTPVRVSRVWGLCSVQTSLINPPLSRKLPGAKSTAPQRDVIYRLQHNWFMKALCSILSFTCANKHKHTQKCLTLKKKASARLMSVQVKADTVPEGLFRTLHFDNGKILSRMLP